MKKEKLLILNLPSALVYASHASMNVSTIVRGKLAYHRNKADQYKLIIEKFRKTLKELHNR